jgi:glyoxylase-like metal-dependent hydrolase (beta-lactamase superfamily II)
MSPYAEDLGYGVTLIDAELYRRGQVATYLVIEGDRAAFIETGTAHSVPALLDVLESKGIPPQNVDYVIPTHVHLDHAGGAGALMARLPEARLVIHPRGARHMLDPGKLVAGASEVYGAGEMERMFGDILPVPQERVIEAPDAFVVDLNGRELRFLDTPGHARHHFCVVDPKGQGIFTGDTFGLSYRWFDTASGPFILPTTTPVQFDPPALHASIDRLVAEELPYMYLTHYGRVRDVRRLVDELHTWIDAFVAMAQACADAGPDRHGLLVAEMQRQIQQRLEAHGCRLSPEQVLDYLGPDIELNVQGLEVWIRQKGTE